MEMKKIEAFKGVIAVKEMNFLARKLCWVSEGGAHRNVQE